YLQPQYQPSQEKKQDYEYEAIAINDPRICAQPQPFQNASFQPCQQYSNQCGQFNSSCNQCATANTFQAPTQDNQHFSQSCYQCQSPPKPSRQKMDKSSAQSSFSSKAKISFKRFVIFLFIVVIGILASFIASDIVTEGQVFKKMSMIANSSTQQQDFYVVVLKEFGTYEDAQKFSVSSRAQGASGFIIKQNQKFCVVGDVFDKSENAEKVSEKQIDSSVMLLSIPNINYKTLPKPFDKKLSAHMSYALSIVKKLNEIIAPLSTLELSESEAMSKIYAEYISMQDKCQKFELFCKKYPEKFVADISCDMYTNLSLLDNLRNDKLSRPNLVSDIRYYKMQILVNFQALCNNLNGEVKK
ncbi:MAG: hypothetical protein RR348_06060, partial [Clostridia bacterium]